MEDRFAPIEGLSKRSPPAAIASGQAAEARNVAFDRGALEPVLGAAAVSSNALRAGAPHFRPSAVTYTAELEDGWKDGYLVSPYRARTAAAIEAHARLEADAVLPVEGVETTNGRTYGPLTGRSAATLGSVRAGGEHQFSPIVALGARPIEPAVCGLGFGVVRPSGLKDGALADAGARDRIQPVFYWWDGAAAALRVSAADFTVMPGFDYHLAVVLGSPGAWYVNGELVTTDSGDGLYALPATIGSEKVPVYFGRCPLRSTSLSYALVDRKRTAMGRWSCAASAATATTVSVNGQELGFAAFVAGSSYVGWRVRAVTGPSAGSIFTVTNSALAGADNLTLTLPNGHGILAGNTIDVVPMVEPMPVPLTVQEVRFWSAAPSAATIQALAMARAAVRPLDEKPLVNLLAAAGASWTDVSAYWPLSTDGDVEAELVSGADAFPAPGIVGISESSAAGNRVLVLDGETNGIQLDLWRDARLPACAPNFGRRTGQDSHWNICARMKFALGAELWQAAGAATSHIYETLLSVGSPGSAALEFRVTRSGGVNVVYVVLPNGTTQTIAFNPEAGRTYDALLGIEALTAGSTNHQVYFHAFDGSGAVVGGFSGLFALPAAELNITGRVRAIFGASVAGTSGRGAGASNHAQMSVRGVALGFHPAHTAAASLATSDLCFPLRTESIAKARLEIADFASGVSVSNGSNLLTVQAGRALPAYLRRWPVAIRGAEVLLRRKGEADRFVQDVAIVASVTSNQLTLTRTRTGPTIYGAEALVETWFGQTALETAEPWYDEDRPGAVDPDETTFALAEDAYLSEFSGGPNFSHVHDPTYDYLSPLRIIPSWTRGIVLDPHISVDGIGSVTTPEGATGVLAIAGGSAYELDTRWRLDRPHGIAGHSIALRRDGGQREAVYLDTDALLLATTTYAGPFTATENGAWLEAWVKLDGIDGVRTLFSFGAQEIVGGLWCWQKRFHFFLDHGVPTLEIRDDSAGVLRRSQSTARDAGIVAQEWLNLAVFIEGTVGTSNITAVTFFVGGRPASGSAIAAIALSALPTSGVFLVGAAGNHNTGPLVGVLGGLLGGFRCLNLGSSAAYVPDRIDETADLDQVRNPCSDGAGWVVAGNDAAAFLGTQAIHRASGLGRGTQPVVFAAFASNLYFTNGKRRPFAWDLGAVVPAGILPPAGRIQKVEPVRSALRVRSADASFPTGVANLANLVVGLGPNMTLWAGSTPAPSSRDVGCLVVVPSDPSMGVAGDFPGGYIGIVLASATTGYTLSPSPYTQQAMAAANAAWMLFRVAQTTLGATALAYLDAIQKLTSTSPFGVGRLMPDGHNSVDVPRGASLATAITAAGAYAFKGSHFVEAPAFQADAMPVGQGDVLDIKGYIWCDDFDVSGDDEQVIAENATDSESGSWRIVIFGGGRVRFEFFDVGIGAMRSIQTSGRVLSSRQWFYFRLRYKYKAAGRCAHDSTGGWEPDQRWSWKTAAAGQVQKDRQYRDGLWVFACEGLHRKDAGIQWAAPTVGYYGDVDQGAPCALLTLPGCQTQVGTGGASVAAGTPLTHNHSQALPNVGLLASAPFLSPERGDTLFPAVSAAGVDSGITLTILVNTIQSLAAGIAAVNFQLPAGFCLPRAWSMNRDDAFDRNHSSLAAGTQIGQPNGGIAKFYNQTTGPTAVVTATPNLAKIGIGTGDVYGQRDAWAVLVRCWVVVTNGGGPGAPGTAIDVVGGSGDAARVLALVHLGSNDLANSARGGVAAHSIYLTDDVAYGGDGGGPLRVGGVAMAAGATIHATIELPNGLNQSRVSTNRSVFPSLLQHGTNPVGLNDAPDTSLAPVRFGGTQSQGLERRVKSGFRGRLDEWGFSVVAVQASASAIYTTDCLPPDAFFTGPADTRIQSLPVLRFDYNAASVDDTGNAWSGTPATRATLHLALDEASGNVATKGSATSAAAAPNGTVVQQGSRVQGDGLHRFRIAYYDPKRNIESNMGREFALALDGAQGVGDLLEAETTFALRGVPISPERARVLWRRIYKTFPDAATFLLWHEVQDGVTSGIAPSLDDRYLAVGSVGKITHGAAPRCRTLHPTETTMLYGSLDDAASVVAYSLPFTPEAVPGRPVIQVESGRGSGVVAMAFLRGVVVIATRGALFVAQETAAGFQTRRVGQSAGALSPAAMLEANGVLLYPSPAGIIQFTGHQQTSLASAALERWWAETVAMDAMARSSAAYYHRRNVAMVSIARDPTRLPDAVLTAERRFNQFGDPFYVWSMLEFTAEVSALAEVNDGDRGSELYIGTRARVGILDGAVGYLLPQLETDVSVSVDGMLSIDADSLTTLNPELLIADALIGVPVTIFRWLDENGQPGDAEYAQGYEIVQETTIAHRRQDGTAVLADLANDAVGMTERALVGGVPWSWLSREFWGDDIDSWKTWDRVDFLFDSTVVECFVELLIDGDLWKLARISEAPMKSYTVSGPKVGRRLQFRLYGWAGTPAPKVVAVTVTWKSDNIGEQKARDPSPS